VVLFVQIYDKYQVNRAPEGAEKGGREGAEEGEESDALD
jgi:hypothetical protein